MERCPTQTARENYEIASARLRFCDCQTVFSGAVDLDHTSFYAVPAGCCLSERTLRHESHPLQHMILEGVLSCGRHTFIN